MLKTEIQNSIARVTLDRPEIHNALNEELIGRLTQTFKELGFKIVNGRGAVVGPANLPEPIRARLEAAVAKSLKDPKVKEAFASVATEINGMSGADMRKVAIEDREVWKQMLSTN